MPAGWRAMRADDLTPIMEIAAIVHPGMPEDAAVLDERRRLYPAGCFVHGRAGTVDGYLISHPWQAFAPPPLNRALGALPVAPTTYYVHDLALHPSVQGRGVAGPIIRHVVATLGARTGMSLVAVNGSVGFWARLKFAIVERPELAAKLASYGADARFMARAHSQRKEAVLF